MQQVFEKWIEAAQIRESYQLLKTFIFAGKKKFICTREIGYIFERVKNWIPYTHTHTHTRDIGTAYFDAKRDIDSAYSNPDITFGAASHTERPYH